MVPVSIEHAHKKCEHMVEKKRRWLQPLHLAIQNPNLELPSSFLKDWNSVGIKPSIGTFFLLI